MCVLYSLKTHVCGVQPPTIVMISETSFPLGTVAIDFKHAKVDDVRAWLDIEGCDLHAPLLPYHPDSILVCVVSVVVCN